MKLKYLRHEEIDRQKWDDCLRQSPTRKIYAASWYLDIVSPGWDALVGDAYTHIFPLTHHSRMGIRYLYQPWFTQQLGLFSRVNSGKDELGQCLERAGRRFSYCDIHLNDGNNFPVEEWTLIARKNHELALSHSYEKISTGYSQNTRRNLRKSAIAGVAVGPPPEHTELVGLFRENFGKMEGKLGDREYEMMLRLMEALRANGMGHSEGCYDSAGKLSAGAFFVNDGGRLYFLFAASASTARENGAMFMLVDRFIRSAAGNADVLDFEGGNDTNLGRFYKGFGATEVIYHRAVLNRLPVVARMGHKMLGILAGWEKRLFL